MLKMMGVRGSVSRDRQTSNLGVSSPVGKKKKIESRPEYRTRVPSGMISLPLNTFLQASWLSFNSRLLTQIACSKMAIVGISGS